MTKTPKPTEKKPTDTAPTSHPQQKQLLHEWTAYERPFKKLDKEIFSTVLAAGFLIGVILFFIDGLMPVIMLISLLFLFYVFGNVKPRKLKHTITNWGIESENKSWPWEVMTRYWIQGKGSNQMVVIETILRWPTHLRFMLGDTEPQKIHNILQEYLIEDHPSPNWLDKAGAWVESKIRLTPDS